MTKWTIVLVLFGAALLSGLCFLVVSESTVVPLVARGTGPNGVQVTTNGWLALLMSIFGTGGFTLAGIVTAFADRLGIAVPSGSKESLVSEVVELTASFAALMNDSGSRATQRRFFFALVDAARLINGCETSHEGGVIVIKYSGYADPVVVSQQGAKI